MLDIAIKVLEKINEAGFSAYIVGGFVRDYILGMDSNDIDICTNAKPKELLEIFDNAKVPKEDYGSVTIFYKDVRFEITTFRREIKYVNNRKPEEIEYIDSLELDIMRRDFTINSLCIDKDKNIIDLLDGEKDIHEGIIKTIGDANRKFSDDALRILRAVRFATKLRFKLSDEVISAIENNKALLKNISYERKKEELDKIFTCSNAKDGIKLLIDLELDVELEIPKLKKVNYTESLMGIWTILDVVDIYKFSNNEKDAINLIGEALALDNLDSYNLYKLGLYANSVAGAIKGISNELITKNYNDLVIKSRNDILVSAGDICKVLDKEPGKYLNELFEDLEKNILSKKLANQKEVLLKYCVDNYK